MSNRKSKPVQTFPVMDGAGPAPREDQIAGIVQRVWAESRVYHEDVEALLTEWLGVEGCVGGLPAHQIEAQPLQRAGDVANRLTAMRA